MSGMAKWTSGMRAAAKAMLAQESNRSSFAAKEQEKRIADLEAALTECRSWADCSTGICALRISAVVDRLLGPLDPP